MACDCIAKVNKKLEPKFNALETSMSGDHVRICTYATKHRARKVTLVPTFCPFCGVRMVPSNDEQKT